MMALRTKKGNVTSEARKRYGNKTKNKQGQKRFPIFDKKSALSALRLRGRARSEAERRSIINRAAKYAPEAARRARERDRKRKKK